jgi:uncharacterized membrane protein
MLALLAFAIAFVAWLKSRDVSSRLERMELDRRDLVTKVTGLERQIERLKNTGAAAAAPKTPPPGPTPDADAPLPAPPVSESVSKPATTTAVPAKAPEILTAPSSAPVGRNAAVTPPTAPPAPMPPPRPVASLRGGQQGPPDEATPLTHASAVEPPSAPIDWESLVGTKATAWVAGIALIIGAIFFARWTVEQGIITPAARFALMLLTGTGALVAAELGLRRGYERTANPLSGAGIAVLYAAFYAGHVRYELFSMPMAFAGMVLVTITACLVSVRYDAFPTAVLGLLGGFATPVALSTGVDRPVGLFSYILLLNIGLLAVGIRQRWHGLFELGLLGTLLIQIGWFADFMSPANMVVGVAVFTIFGLLYLVLPVISKEGDNDRVMLTGALGGVMPFLFAFVLAGSPQYIREWPLLFGMAALVDLAILIMAITRGRVGLFLSAATATSITMGLWALHGLHPRNEVSVMGPTLFAIFLTGIFAVSRRGADRFGKLDTASFRPLEIAALLAWAGLAWFALVLLGHQRVQPPDAFLTLAAALLVLLIERTSHEGRLDGVLAVGSIVLASLIQIWFFSAVSAPTVVLYLFAPLSLSVVFSFFAAWRLARGKVDAEAEVAVRLSAWIAIFGLFLCLVQRDTAREGWPLFGSLVAYAAIVTLSVLRSDWTIGLPALLGATAVHLLVWQVAYLDPSRHSMAFAFNLLFYYFFLLLPILVPFARWRTALLPWLTSALSGPVFFLPLYHVYREAFGKSTIGLLPVAMAAVSIGVLRVVSARFTVSIGDPSSAHLRLRYLALFSTVALWFIAVAIPVQFDRQWITLGWAIEAMAVCWLFGRLPHRGLPVFAGVLYALVALRLLFNPAILEYEPHAMPVFNWILYTYGIATACCLIGQRLLRRGTPDVFLTQLANAVAFAGILLGFWLVNLEILDYFSPGPFIAISHTSGYSVKLALSAGWALYSMILLISGVALDVKAVRYLSLAFLLLTVAKVFLYDLSELGGIFRVFSFLGLAIALILVSVFYQRFVFKKAPRR